MTWEYWKLILKRAIKEAFAGVGITTLGGTVVAAIAYALSIVIAAVWLGSEGAEDYFYSGLIAVCVAALMFPGYFAWKLLGVPAELHNELSAQNAKLAAALGIKGVNRTRALTLSLLLEEGRDLLGDKIAIEQFAGWQEEVDRWGFLVVKYLAHAFSHQAAISIKFITYTKANNFLYKISDEHNDKLRELSARLEQLRLILEGVKEEWSPIGAKERETIKSELAIFEVRARASEGADAGST